MYTNIFSNMGGFERYPHIIALSKELKKNGSLKRYFYGIPLLILRNSNNTICVFIDVCPHKRAPLHAENGEIVCNYHGWNFDQTGKLQKIPSSPGLEKKLHCKLHTLKTEEKYGFIWILPAESSQEEIPNLVPSMEPGSKTYFAQKLFLTTPDNLIENFMDATHAGIVHDAIIRSNTKRTEHTIDIQENPGSITAHFHETTENVGLGVNSFLGNVLKIEHTDTFLPPNIVRVKYTIQGKERFEAYIACTESKEGETYGFVRITYNFGFFLNGILGLILPHFSKKVLKQDFEITRDQYGNQKLFNSKLSKKLTRSSHFSETPTIRETSIDYDLLHFKVQHFRERIKNNTPHPEKSSSKTITLHL